VFHSIYLQTNGSHNSDTFFSKRKTVIKSISCKTLTSQDFTFLTLIFIIDTFSLQLLQLLKEHNRNQSI